MNDRLREGPTFELEEMSYKKGCVVGRSMIGKVWEVVANPEVNKGPGAEAGYLLAGVMWTQLMHKQQDNHGHPDLALSMVALILLKQKLDARQLPLS